MAGSSGSGQNTSSSGGGFGLPGTHGGITGNPNAPIYGQTTPPPPPPAQPAQPQPAQPASGPTQPQGAAPDPNSYNSEGSLQSFLSTLGLGDFADIAWNAYLQNGKNIDAAVSAIRNSDLYKQEFPNAAALFAGGYIHSEADYLSAISTFRDLNHTYGIPASYDSAADISQLLLGHVSADEWKSRLEGAQTAALSSLDLTTRSELMRTLGATTGDLTAVWLNPSEDLGHLQQNLQAGLIGAQSDLSGFGQLSVAQLQDLAARGVTTDQAHTGFQQLAADRNLYTALPGQTQEQLDQATLLSAQFGGNAAAQQQIEAIRRQRIGAFQGGGAVAGSQGGVGGLSPNAT